MRDRQAVMERGTGRQAFGAPQPNWNGAAQDAQQENKGPLGWWFRIAAPPTPPNTAPFAVRERVRRARLAAALLLAFIILNVFALPVGIGDPTTLYELLGSLIISLILVFFNRQGWVEITGGTLVVLVDAVLIAAILLSGLSTVDIPLYDLMVISELFAVSLLPPWTVFVVALLNSAFILLDTRFGPINTDLHAILTSDQTYAVVIRPIVLHIIIAVVAYLWVRSSLDALRRADRAEELAALEAREIDRNRELEQGVRDLLSVHVQLANGNFNARVPQIANTMLWQIGSSLNNLIGRLSRLAQAEFQLRRTAEETHRLGEALRALLAGRAPIWPAPSGTPADEVIEPLQRILARSGAGGYPVGQGGMGGMGGMGGPAPMGQLGPAGGIGQTGQMGPMGAPSISMPPLGPQGMQGSQGMGSPGMPNPPAQRMPGGMPRGPMPSTMSGNLSGWQAPQYEPSGRGPQQPQSLSPEELQSQLPEWLRTQMGQPDTTAQSTQSGRILPRFPAQPNTSLDQAGQIGQMGQTGAIDQPDAANDQDVWPEPFPDLDGGGLPPRQR